MASQAIDSCLVFRRSKDSPLGSTFFVGARRYRVVREINDWGRHAVIARPCKWYDGLEVAGAWLQRLMPRRAATTAAPTVATPLALAALRLSA